jgi:hypothetical protein
VHLIIVPQSYDVKGGKDVVDGKGSSDQHGNEAEYPPAYLWRSAGFVRARSEVKRTSSERRSPLKPLTGTKPMIPQKMGRCRVIRKLYLVKEGGAFQTDLLSSGNELA